MDMWKLAFLPINLQFAICNVPIIPYLRALIQTHILEMSTQITGTVKFFNEEKGFGFIKHDDSSTETFVHAKGLIDQIEANDKVVFDVQEGRKGPNAVNVRRVS